MSSRLQLVRNLSLGMRHLVNAYEVEAGYLPQVRCNLQVTLCDPYLSALSGRDTTIKALYKSTSFTIFLPLQIPDHFSTSLSVAEYGIVGDLLAFLANRLSI